MELKNIEFYTSPDGDVLVKEVNRPVYVLSESHRELINSLMTLIGDRYPKAFGSLMSLYSVNNPNRHDYEYRVVHRFLRCNFGSYDQLRIDIDANGRMHFEEVQCPLRGECPYDGIICRPTLCCELSSREKEVAELLVEGKKSNEEIAEKLYISPATVKRHRENIRVKLGIHNLAELTAWWLKNKEEGL